MFRVQQFRLSALQQCRQVYGGVCRAGAETFHFPGCEDDDNILTGERRNLQVEVRGFMDSSGQVFATRIRGKGKPDNGAIRLPLAGPVFGLNEGSRSLALFFGSAGGGFRREIAVYSIGHI